MSTKPWTEAHTREALRRTYEIAAELAEAGRAQDAAIIVIDAVGYAETEARWRCNLGHPEPALDASRINREVRRVRALAEGRLVRDEVTMWHVSVSLGTSSSTAGKARRVRTRSIRRAT